MCTHPSSPDSLSPNNTRRTTIPSSPPTVVAGDPAAGLSNSHKPPAGEHTVAIATGGAWSKLSHHSSIPPRKVTWKRGRIRQYSVKSRSRLIQSMCQTDMRNVSPGILFVTLTYPSRWSPDPHRWHIHLEEWCDRLCRRFPASFAYWKLEFQKRGAPHFHLLLFNCAISAKLRHAFKRWVSRSWAAVVDSPDPKHLRAGTNVQEVASVRQVKRYASKYVGKAEDQPPDGFSGRIWGIHNRKARPVSVVTAPISEGEFFALRRSFRRYMGARRGFYRPGGADSGCWAALSDGTVKRLLDYLVAEVDPASGVIGERFGWTEARGQGKSTLPPAPRIKTRR